MYLFRHYLFQIIFTATNKTNGLPKFRQAIGTQFNLISSSFPSKNR